MARIIGGIAASHTPTIGFAVDKNKQDDPVWAPIFKDFEPVQKWLDEKKPDAIVLIFNDHITSFFFDHYSAFALGVGDQYKVADEGGGARNIPPALGHPELARHIGQSLMNEEFDMSFFQDKALDHGFFSPLSVMCKHDHKQWSTPIIPLQIGVLQFPIPSAKRCYKLGQALKRAVESYPEDLKVAIVSTGGLSHQVHGERCGFNNTPWDEQFLDLFEKDPERLTRVTHAEYAELGGLEGAEVIMWLIMRGAMNSQVRKLHQSYYLPSMTAIATVLFENDDIQPVAGETARLQAEQATQLKGAEKLTGTYPYDLARSAKGYRINKFLRGLTDAERRARFLENEAAEMERAGLTSEEIDLILRRDWRGLIHYGAIFFVLEKLGAVVGVSNLHIYAAMRGQTLEEFQKTRNAPGALYSVAGQVDEKKWSR